MPISMSYPGVYVKEDNALSMSISSGSTAVPVFIFNPFVEAVGTLEGDFKFKPTDGLIRIESWLDYLGKFEEWTGGQDEEDFEKSIDDLIKSVEKDKKNNSPDVNDLSYDGINKDTTDEEDVEKLRKLQTFIEAEKSRVAIWPQQYNSFGYYDLRNYFDNGGGPCYLYLYSIAGVADFTSVDANIFNETDFPYEMDSDFFKELSEFISSNVDVSLICLCANSAVNKKLYRAVSGLLSQSISHSAPLFCLQGGDSANRKDYESGEAKQSAVYYPSLMTSYKYETKDVMEQLGNIIKGKKTLEGLVNSDAENIAFGTVQNIRQNQTKSDDITKGLNVLIKERNVVLSPVAAIAGAYCRNDSQRGVWKAPANITLNGVIGLCDSFGDEVVITDATNGDLIAEGINPIRYFPGKGFTVWGARTLDTATGSKWKYIPVRRLFNIAERDIKEAMAKAVFEPNTSLTWETIRSAVDAYLHNLWKQGALFGDTAEQAYFVKIGLGSTMDEQDIKDGKMIIKVGMSPVSPAEFIILEFSQKQI